MRKVYQSGTIWEELASFSRALKLENTIYISGTTATDNEGNVVGKGNVEEQTRYILVKIKTALSYFNASLENIVRTRVYIKNINDWEKVAKLHGEYFKNILPANTMVQAGIIGEEYLVEIEAEAFIN
ncbi:MAG: RidA family protein [Candidatus Dojkabacteria bacterium]